MYFGPEMDDFITVPEAVNLQLKQTRRVSVNVLQP